MIDNLIGCEAVARWDVPAQWESECRYLVAQVSYTMATRNNVKLKLDILVIGEGRKRGSSRVNSSGDNLANAELMDLGVELSKSNGLC